MWKLLKAAPLALALCAPGLVQAQVATCDTGVIVRPLAEGGGTTTYHFDFEDGGVLGVAVEGVAGAGPLNVILQIRNSVGTLTGQKTYTADDDEEFSISPEDTYTVTFTNNSPTRSARVAAQCTNPGPSAELLDQARSIQTQIIQGAANSANLMVGNALSSARSLRGTGGATVSSNLISFSTRNGAADSGWTAWGTVGLTRFNGRTDGSARAFTFGLDYAAGPRLALGVLASAGFYDQVTQGVRLTGRAIDVGPYLIYDLGRGFDLEAFATYGRPTYDLTGGALLKTTRYTVGAKLRAQYDWNDIRFDSAVSLRGFREHTPAFAVLAARNVEDFVASISTKMTFNRDEVWQPSLGLGLDATRSRDGLGATRTWVSPRGSLGIGYANAGTEFSASLDVGRSLRDTTDLSLNLGLSVRF